MSIPILVLISIILSVLVPVQVLMRLVPLLVPVLVPAGGTRDVAPAGGALDATTRKRVYSKAYHACKTELMKKPAAIRECVAEAARTAGRNAVVNLGETA